VVLVNPALQAVLEAGTIVFAGIGAFFFLVGTIGLLRLPDFYSRTHAATKCDTLGAGSILLSLALYHGIDFDSAKILVIALLILLSSPTAGHALARAAYRTGLRLWTAPKPGEE
jgi:monovalent cation/proton antiporter MnhG/PhaG subunit